MIGKRECATVATLGQPLVPSLSRTVSRAVRPEDAGDKPYVGLPFASTKRRGSCVYRLRDGQITRGRVLSNPADALDAVGLSE